MSLEPAHPESVTVHLTAAQEPEEYSVDLLRLLAILLSEWRLGLLVAALVLATGVAYTYSIPALYEASASILPQSSRPDPSSLASVFSGSRSEDIYVGLLQSRSVADDVVNSLDLMQIFKSKSRIDARLALMSGTKFGVGADSIITITVRNKDAVLATRIANAYLEALQRQGESMGMKQATEHEKFYQAQLDQEKLALAKAETELRDVEQKTGVVQADSQAQAGLSAIANIRGQITALQVQLAGLLQGETENNPQVVTLNSQIRKLQAQEAELESNSGGRAGAPSTAGSIPSISLEVARKQREVRYHESLMTSLSTRYEAARLSDVSEGTAFSIVDQAEIPERKAWPPRRTFLEFAGVAAVLLGLVSMVLAIVARRIWNDPVERGYLREIRQTFSRPGTNAISKPQPRA